MVLLTLVNVILQKVTTKRSMPKDHGADTIQEVHPLVFVCHCHVCVCVCVAYPLINREPRGLVTMCKVNLFQCL